MTLDTQYRIVFVLYKIIGRVGHRDNGLSLTYWITFNFIFIIILAVVIELLLSCVWFRSVVKIVCLVVKSCAFGF